MAHRCAIHDLCPSPAIYELSAQNRESDARIGDSESLAVSAECSLSKKQIHGLNIRWASGLESENDNAGFDCRFEQV